MRRFYESWNNLEPNSVVLTTELQNNDSEEKSIRRLSLTNDENFPITAFLNISFTHHIAIIRNVKTLEERKYDYYCLVKLTSSFFGGHYIIYADMARSVNIRHIHCLYN